MLMIGERMKTWETIKQTLINFYNDSSVDPWLNTLNVISFDNNSLIISVPDQFSYDWIKNHFLNDIIRVVRDIDGNGIEVSLILEDGNTDEINNIEPVKGNQFIDKVEAELREKYSLENFVEGECNKFAFAAAQAVAKGPGHTYNPLFIYGGVGLGKTHLVNAIGNHIKKEYKLYVIYVSAEAFVNDLVHHLKTNKMDSFRETYRNCDVLLIDDIEFISNKEKTQEEIFHTFNKLYEEKKQIVFTSDRLPKEIPGIEERLRSRFEMGLIADIQAPDVETKVAIVKKKAEQNNIDIDDDIAFFLAYNTLSNIRELEGYLTRLSAYAYLTKTKLNINVAKEVLASVIKKKDKWVTIEDIQKAISLYFKIKVSDLNSQKRMRYIAYPRQIAMYLARTLTNASFPEIGTQFGNKDHSTVIHSVNKIDNLYKTDQSVKDVIEKIKKGL